jgi:hypothetical protein
MFLATVRFLRRLYGPIIVNTVAGCGGCRKQSPPAISPTFHLGAQIDSRDTIGTLIPVVTCGHHRIFRFDGLKKFVVSAIPRTVMTYFVNIHVEDRQIVLVAEQKKRQLSATAFIFGMPIFFIVYFRVSG